MPATSGQRRLGDGSAPPEPPGGPAAGGGASGQAASGRSLRRGGGGRRAGPPRLGGRGAAVASGGGAAGGMGVEAVVAPRLRLQRGQARGPGGLRDEEIVLLLDPATAPGGPRGLEASGGKPCVLLGDGLDPPRRRDRTARW